MNLVRFIQSDVINENLLIDDLDAIAREDRSRA